MSDESDDKSQPRQPRTVSIAVTTALLATPLLGCGGVDASDTERTESPTTEGGETAESGAETDENPGTDTEDTDEEEEDAGTDTWTRG